MKDPFKIKGPALISVSGGRTSGYMLLRILRAHGGKLPDDVHAAFANTGKEMPETLDFVKAMQDKWGVHIEWLEYQSAEKADDRWIGVSYDNASRAGEPYAALIKDKQFLPNPVMRFCTTWLKIKPMEQYAEQVLHFEDNEWANVIGLRADEPSRVAKMRLTTNEMPLAKAGITKADVMAFWRANDFDLLLPPGQGNCDLCFLKSARTIQGVMRDVPESAQWWVDAEATPLTSNQYGGRFRSDRPSYAEMAKAVREQREFDFGIRDEIVDCFCGDPT